jgi:hypothetical protein
MTFTRLTLFLCIGIAAVDYVFNDGRLTHAAVDFAAQLGAWLSDQLSGLVDYLTGH